MKNSKEIEKLQDLKRKKNFREETKMRGSEDLSIGGSGKKV